MSDLAPYLIPLGVAAFAWFLSTGLVFRLDSLPCATFGRTMIAASVVAAGALWMIARTAHELGPRGAYSGFAAALVVWGWHEISFLTGLITGPNRASATPGIAGWGRFVQATRTLIHHEIALALTTAGLVAMCWGQPNQMAAITFALLFGMRLSTKLNIFAGVPQPASDLLPTHLAYLKTYFRRKAAGALMIGSLAAAAATAAILAARALTAAPGSGDATGFTLLFGLATLGVIEHLFLALPIRDAALFQWAAVPPALQPKTTVVTAGTATKYL